MAKAKPKSNKPQKLSPFTVLSGLNTYTISQYNGKRSSGTQRLYSDDEVKESGLDIYLLLQFIKNDPILINIACYLNEHHKMKIYDMYLFTFFSFKHAEIGGINWIKSLKSKHPADVKLLMRYYKIGYSDAMKYLDFIDVDNLNEIKKIIDPNVKL